MASKSQILSLYKTLLKESNKFPNYNFRHYAVRRVRDAFKENKNITDPMSLKKEIQYATENIAIIRRQVRVAGSKLPIGDLSRNGREPDYLVTAAIGQMYKSDKLVIENTNITF